MNFENPWVKNGLLYGAVSIIFQLLVYYVLPSGMFIQMIFGLASLIYFYIMACREQKEENGGTLSYGQAFKTTALTGIIGVVMSGLFTLILIQLIDPSLVDKLIEMAMESTKSMMETFGAPEDAASEALDNVENEMADQFTPVGQLMNIVKGSIFVLIPAAIASIFLKKEEKIV
ncbi:MAG: DUF4199 domain-containing protein [Saprospiraceae bacterium]|nr:DUF4199 domain-containing protein [Saprospiraceae bacterium]MBK8670917.1 DUF4199 domain-containing protein [Saprospiraceae bacterium]MBL0100811.1 DUF4199 domain-containing protein [Saprospiraceae bacterium]